METGGVGEAELELERERRGREIHPSTAEREQEERFKKAKGRAQTWALLLLSCDQLPASALGRDLYPFLSPGLCLGGVKSLHRPPCVEHTVQPFQSHEHRVKPEKGGSDPRSTRRVPDTLKYQPAC